MYLTYDEYTEMGGEADETSFTHLEKKAEKLIDDATYSHINKFSRIRKGLSERQAMIVYVEELKKKAEREGTVFKLPDDIDFVFSDEEVELIKECVFSLINISQNTIEQNGGKIVQSTSNDGVSESYKVYNSIDEYYSYVDDIICEYLLGIHYNNVPVIYRGVAE